MKGENADHRKWALKWAPRGCTQFILWDGVQIHQLMLAINCKWLPREKSGRRGPYIYKTYNSSSTDYEYWFNKSTEEKFASCQDKEDLIGSLIAKISDLPDAICKEHLVLKRTGEPFSWTDIKSKQKMKLLEYINLGIKQLSNEVRIEQLKNREWKTATYCDHKKHKTFKFVSSKFSLFLYQIYMWYM